MTGAAVAGSRFRETLGHLAKGVTIVTARRPDGTPSGLTATSVCSVSLDPPLVLVCIERDTRTHGVVGAAGSYAVNVLRDDQVELARLFSTEADQKFLEVEWRAGTTGSPVLVRAVAHVECAVVKTVPAGDHTIYVGEVRKAEVRKAEVREAEAREAEAREAEARESGGEPARPLLYYRAAYRSLGSGDPL